MALSIRHRFVRKTSSASIVFTGVRRSLAGNTERMSVRIEEKTRSTASFSNLRVSASPRDAFRPRSQKVLLHFSQRGARNRIDLHEAPRHFEGCEILAARSFERFRIERTGDDECDWYFAAHFVRFADDRGLGHTRLFEKELFDFARVDVEAAGDDQIGLAAEEGVVAAGGAG